MQISKEILQKYAELIVRTGVNVQSGQVVQLTISVEQHDFAALFVHRARDAPVVRHIAEKIERAAKRQQPALAQPGGQRRRGGAPLRHRLFHDAARRRGAAHRGRRPAQRMGKRHA